MSVPSGQCCTPHLACCVPRSQYTSSKNPSSLHRKSRVPIATSVSAISVSPPCYLTGHNEPVSIHVLVQCLDQLAICIGILLVTPSLNIVGVIPGSFFCVHLAEVIATKGLNLGHYSVGVPFFHDCQCYLHAQELAPVRELLQQLHHFPVGHGRYVLRQGGWVLEWLLGPLRQRDSLPVQVRNCCRTSVTHLQIGHSPSYRSCHSGSSLSPGIPCTPRDLVVFVLSPKRVASSSRCLAEAEWQRQTGRYRTP